jgi:APA family basic amino acid/polyamine antiporter
MAGTGVAVAAAEKPIEKSDGFVRGLGLFDSTMIVVGVMIGSGIFIVSADMARQIGSPGWLLIAWVVTGFLTITGALSYGELAAMMPRAGGMYIYLREAYSPLVGFLYGWTFFAVIQTGSIAAVAIAFSRFTGVIWPVIAEDRYLVSPVHFASGYAMSLSTAQLLGILVIVLLTWANTRGLRTGKMVQNIFTVAKTCALLGLIGVGLTVGWNAAAVHDNFAQLWTIRHSSSTATALNISTTLGLFIALCVAQPGSLFSADSWHNITFTAGEVKNPKRNLPMSLLLGTGIVIVLYLLANLAYLVTLPFAAVQNAPSDRVATAALQVIFPGAGTTLMAAAIMISTFGCINALSLAGARAYYAMSRDGLFFRQAGELNKARVPGAALVAQGVWAAVLVLPRTFDARTGHYGNLYGNLLDYVISAALLFYLLTIVAVFRLRVKLPDAERPYRAFGYPVLPALYLAGAGTVLLVLLVFRPSTTWPGFAIVALGAPIYFLISPRRRQRSQT